MGKVISFEGLSGVGKTTLIKNIKKDLSLKGLKVGIIEELGIDELPENSIGRSVMEVFTYSSDPYLRQYDPHIDTFFSQATRYVICSEIISQKKKEYDILLEDRGVDTYMSYALAGFNKELNLSFISQYKKLCLMNSLFDEVADITILLKDDIKNCVDRSIKRGNREIQSKDEGFMYYLDKAYDFLLNNNQDRIKVVYVNGENEKQVSKRVLFHLMQLI